MGNCCQRINNKENTAKDRKIIEKLADNKHNKLKALEEFSSPSKLDTSQLTDVYSLPTENFKTKDDVIKHYGYRIGRLIGKGSFANVFEAQNLAENITVAVKIVEPVDRNKKKYWVSVKNELFILQKIRHPNIVQVIEHFIIDSILYIFMEYASGGSLSHLLEKKGSFNEKDGKQMFAMILSGVSKMHSENIAHRDLKMSNILVAKDGRLLISDFGLSKVFIRTNEGVVQTNTFCGTPQYMSPEILKNKAYDPFLLDIWALGVILYCLLNGRYPFSQNRVKAIQQMEKRKLTFGHKFKDDPTKELINILKQMLEPEVKKRIAMKDLVKQKWIEKEFNDVQSEAQKMEKIESKVNNETIKTTVS